MIYLHLQIASSCKLSNRYIDLISQAKTIALSIEAWYNELVVGLGTILHNSQLAPVTVVRKKAVQVVAFKEVLYLYTCTVKYF